MNEEVSQAGVRGTAVAILVAILALGVFLRFDGLGEPDLFIDEVIHGDTVERLSEWPVSRWIFGFEGEVENGPIYFATQIAGSHLAERPEIALRLAPAIVGTLSLLLMAFVGRIAGGTPTALVASLLLAASPLHVYYSREGRPYALLMLSSLLLLAGLLRAQPDAPRWTLAGSLTGVLSVVVAIPAIAAVAGLIGVRGLVEARREGRPRRSTLWHAAGPVVAGLLVPVIYLRAYFIGGSTRLPGGLNAAPSTVTQPFSRVGLERLFGSLSVSGVEWVSFEPLVVLFWGLALLGLVLTIRRRPVVGWTVGAFLVSTVLASMIGLTLLGRWYSIRYTSIGLPAFLLLVALGVVEGCRSLPFKRLVGRRSSSWLLTASLVGALTLALAVLPAARRDPLQKANWSGLASFLGRFAEPGDTIIATSWWSWRMAPYYAERAGLSLNAVNTDERVSAAEDALEECGACWLVTGGFHSELPILEWTLQYPILWRAPLDDLRVHAVPDWTSVAEQLGSRGTATLARRLDDLGGRLELRAEETLFLGRGWSPPEVEPDGRSFAWAVGPVAEMLLPSIDGVGLELGIRLRAFDDPGAGPQRLEVLVGDDRVWEGEVPVHWLDQSFVVPSTSLRRGVNRVEFRFERSRVPAEVLPGSQETRPLAAAFDLLEVRRPASPDRGPAPSADGISGP